MSRAFSRLVAGAALTGVLALQALVPGLSRAQEATPIVQPNLILNHLHAGSCPEVGDVVAPLSDLMLSEERAASVEMGDTVPATPMDAIAATPLGALAAAGIPVHVAVTEVELGLADILAAPHAFNAHDPIDPAIYIACGDITGTPDEQGNLFIGVGEQNNSGLSGVVWLLDDGTGTSTTVTVFLVGDFTPVAAPGATPVS